MTNKPTYEELEQYVRRIALRPSTDETMVSTWSPPDWDDLSDWWRDAVEDARTLLSVKREDVSSICKG